MGQVDQEKQGWRGRAGKEGLIRRVGATVGPGEWGLAEWAADYGLG